MNKILSLLDKKQKNIALLIAVLIFFLSIFELLIFNLIQPIIIFFSRDDGVDQIKSIGSKFNLNITAFQILIFFFVIFVIRSLLSVVISYFRQKLIKDINDSLSERIFKKYLNKNFLFFVDSNSSKFISNIILEVDKFAYRLIDSLFYLLADLAIILIVISYLFYAYFLPAIIFFLITLIFFGFFFKVYKKTYKELGERKILHDKEKITQLQNSFYVIQTIKLENLENYFLNKFKVATTQSSKSTFSMQFISELPKNLIEVAMLLIVAVIIGLLFYWFNLSKHEVLSILGLFIFAMFRLLPSSNRVLFSINSIRYYFLTTDTLKQQLEENDKSNNDKSNIEKFKYETENDFIFQDSIKIKKINFSYNNNVEILKDINLDIKKNETIGIKGHSGVGKSTLLNIICGLLTPSSGQILLDNNDISEVYRSYQRKIGYVPQKIYLVDDSIIKNIIFGQSKKKFDYNLFDDVIKKSNLKEFIDNLKDKEDTIIGERGSKLSGGQQQRVGIARALYKKPEIIIFDEATNALDANSENEILKTINTLKKDNTIIIVSHKDSVLDYCDKIFEIKNKTIFKK
jgi:ABC-type bacteriocin/lantibiotic exporter with double-glycine peptidase domain